MPNGGEKDANWKMGNGKWEIGKLENAMYLKDSWFPLPHTSSK